MGQQGGGDLDKVHPPQDGGGGESSQVAHHAAPQSNHGVGASQAKGHHGLPQGGQLVDALALLPSRDNSEGALEAGLCEAGLQTVLVERAHGAVGDHEQPGGPGQNLPAMGPGLGQQAPLDQNVIRSARQGHSEGFHHTASFRW